MVIHFGAVGEAGEPLGFILVKLGEAAFAQVKDLDLAAWVETLKRDAFNGEDVVLFARDAANPEVPVILGTAHGFEILVSKMGGMDVKWHEKEVDPPRPKEIL